MIEFKKELPRMATDTKSVVYGAGSHATGCHGGAILSDGRPKFLQPALTRSVPRIALSSQQRAPFVQFLANSIGKAIKIQFLEKNRSLKFCIWGLGGRNA